MSDRPVITVLVVDDTLANRWVLARILQEAGYTVFRAEKRRRRYANRPAA